MWRRVMADGLRESSVPPVLPEAVATSPARWSAPRSLRMTTGLVFTVVASHADDRRSPGCKLSASSTWVATAKRLFVITRAALTLPVRAVNADGSRAKGGQALRCRAGRIVEAAPGFRVDQSLREMEALAGP